MTNRLDFGQEGGMETDATHCSVACVTAFPFYLSMPRRSVDQSGVMSHLRPKNRFFSFFCKTFAGLLMWGCIVGRRYIASGQTS
jgi:hypothetical protein